MVRLIQKYPIASIALLLLACIHFEYHAATWSIVFGGLVAGLVVLAIIGVVLLFRIFNVVHDACLKKGLISHRLTFRYDILIPIAIIAVLIRGHWQGGLSPALQHNSDVAAPYWFLNWGGDPAIAACFIGAVIGVVFLNRIYVLARAISTEAN